MELSIIPCADNISHLHLKGRLDPHWTKKIDQQFRDETLVPDRPAIVDMSAVTFITSVGIGLLVECAEAVRKLGHKFVIIGPSGTVDEVLKRTGVYMIIPRVSTAADALDLAKE